MLASLRGDRVIAVDANPDRGTLSDKLRLETAATVRDLLNEREQIQRYVVTTTTTAPPTSPSATRSPSPPACGDHHHHGETPTAPPAATTTDHATALHLKLKLKNKK